MVGGDKAKAPLSNHPKCCLSQGFWLLGGRAVGVRNGEGIMWLKAALIKHRAGLSFTLHKSKGDTTALSEDQQDSALWGWGGS